MHAFKGKEDKCFVIMYWICIILLNQSPQSGVRCFSAICGCMFSVSACHGHAYACLCVVCAFLRMRMCTALCMVFSNRDKLKADCQMGIFQDQQNCENKWGPQKSRTLFCCEAERLDSLSPLALELCSLFKEKTNKVVQIGCLFRFLFSPNVEIRT